MIKTILMAAVLIGAPVAAQQKAEMGHDKMGAMDPAKMESMAPAKHDAMDHAKMDMMDHSKMKEMDHAAMMKNSAANPYAEASMAMHKKMMMSTKGADASETWTRQMIEHHRGAIAMSKIATDKATDKETRTMAQKTSAMQQKEIAELQSWLKRHGKPAQ